MKEGGRPVSQVLSKIVCESRFPFNLGLAAYLLEPRRYLGISGHYHTPPSLLPSPANPTAYSTM